MLKEEYGEYYNEEEFQKKLSNLPNTIGRKVIEQALTLYVLVRDPKVPKMPKASIIAALGYFILPVDFIPDFLPGGFLDDLAVMSIVVAQLRTYTNPEILAQVEKLMPEWIKKGDNSICSSESMNKKKKRVSAK